MTTGQLASSAVSLQGERGLLFWWTSDHWSASLDSLCPQATNLLLMFVDNQTDNTDIAIDRYI